MPPRRSLRSSGADAVASSADSQTSSSQTVQGDNPIEVDAVQEELEPSRTAPAPQKTSKFQPKSSARRSQLDRDAQERVESIRRQAQEAEARSLAGRARGRFGRGRGRGRGNLRGDLSSARVEEQPTGPLGSGVVAPKSPTAKRRRQEDSAEVIVEGENGDEDAEIEATGEQAEDSGAKPTRKTRSSTTVTGGEGGPTVATSKSKPKTKATNSKSGTNKTTGESSTIKKEEDGDVIMDEDEDEDKKIDINIDEMAFINLISEDEEDVDEAGNPQKSFNPVRISRNQHVERKPVIESVASSEISEQVRKEAKAKGVSVSEIQIIASDEGVHFTPVNRPAKDQRPRRKQGKAKQVDTEDFKQEDDTTIPRVAADPARSTAVASNTREPIDIPDDDDLTELLPHRIRTRRRHPPIFSKPLLQTAEDHAEWARREEDMQAIAEEFRNVTIPAAGSRSASRENGESTEGRRENRVYLFQLPPIMPNLCTPAEAEAYKQAAQSQNSSNQPEFTSSSSRQDTKASRSTNTQQDTTVKIEDDNTGGSSSKHPEPLSSDAPTAAAAFNPALDAGMMPPCFKGRIGTLTVFENGATELDWGGIPFELDRGMGGMLQETLLVDRDTGLGSSMSQIVANFIVKPSWDRLLEHEE